MKNERSKKKVVRREMKYNNQQVGIENEYANPKKKKETNMYIEINVFPVSFE